MVPTERVLKRVREVTLERFRGFLGPQYAYDTDADLVLLLGPNGRGKTAFVEALQLVLTGVPATRERAGKTTYDYSTLFALCEKRSRGGAVTRHERFVLRARCTFGGDDADVSRELEVNGELVKAERGDEPRAPAEVKLLYKSPDDICYPPEPLPDRSSEKGSPTEPSTTLPGDGYSASQSLEGAELQARLTSYFQHDVLRLFDDAAKGRTVLDLVAPIPVRHRHLLSALESVVDRIEERERKLRKSPEPVETRDAAVLEGYRKSLEELLDLLHPVEPALVELPAASSATELARATSEMLSVLGQQGVDVREVPRRLGPAISQREERWRKWLEAHARGSASDEQVEQWQTEQRSVEDELRRLNKQRPHLAQEGVAFQGAPWPESEPRPGRQPSLGETLQALRSGLQAWRKSAKDGLGPRPADLTRELEAVRSDALDTLWLELRDWEKVLECDVQQLRELQSRQAELERKLRERTPQTGALMRFPDVVARARSVPAQLWSRLLQNEEWEDRALIREAELGALGRLKAEAEACRAAFEQSRKNDPKALKQLAKGINEIMSRFCIAEQPTVTIEVEEANLTTSRDDNTDKERVSACAKLCYADGRGLGELSSGQQSQAAVAMLVAQNLQVAQAEATLRRGMPHRVLLLDDVSSSYDLTNLVRESILWRQLAYTTDPIQKRQMFISSHHEDLTNLLLDQLGPPQGYRMKVLRFVDWTWEKGPIVECFDVEPSHRHDDRAGIEAFQSATGAMFHGA